ncbi:hypothetical protein VKT23_004874 [Stygiomarasmius scandens]|uniref:Uncharacterized protein n=1 Tax=Marasmiellus scandens TaxID=2682957 RepID=A0ABR1JT06_9AGAR
MHRNSPSTISLSRLSSTPIASKPSLPFSSRQQPLKSLSSPAEVYASSPVLTALVKYKVGSAHELRKLCEEVLKTQECLTLSVEGVGNYCDEQIIEDIDALPLRRSIRFWKKSTGLFLEFMPSSVHECCATKFSSAVNEAFFDASNEPKPTLPFELMGSQDIHLDDADQDVLEDEARQPDQCWVPIDNDQSLGSLPSALLEVGYTQTYSGLLDAKNWWLHYFEAIGLVIIINIEYNQDPSRCYMTIELWVRDEAPAHDRHLRTPRAGTRCLQTLTINRQAIHTNPLNLPTHYFHRGNPPRWLANVQSVQIPPFRLIELKDRVFIIADDYEAKKKRRSEKRNAHRRP